MIQGFLLDVWIWIRRAAWNPSGRTAFREVPFTHTRRYAWAGKVRRFRRKLWWNQIEDLKRRLTQAYATNGRLGQEARTAKRDLRLAMKQIHYWKDAAENGMTVLSEVEAAFPATARYMAHRLYPNQVTEIPGWAHMAPADEGEEE